MYCPFRHCTVGVFPCARREEGKSTRIETSTVKKTISSSAVFTVAPALAIVATVITLAKALGIVLPWIRLSVIGAIQYEVPAAEAAVEAFEFRAEFHRR